MGKHQQNTTVAGTVRVWHACCHCQMHLSYRAISMPIDIAGARATWWKERRVAYLGLLVGWTSDRKRLKATLITSTRQYSSVLVRTRFEYSLVLVLSR